MDTVQTVLPEYAPTTIAGIPCYTNGRQSEGIYLFWDGSLQSAGIVGYIYQTAGAAVTKGTLRIMARVTGPQTSYRAELVGAAIVTPVVLDRDHQHIDNKAVTLCATEPPHKECSNMTCVSRFVPTHGKNKWT